MKRIKILSIFLILSILLLSCKTKEKISQKQISELSSIYDRLSDNYLDYQSLYIKSSISFNKKKKSLKLKSSIKILKDSLIIVSLSPGLGIEAARIKFTKDSIFILDRMSSQLTKAGYKYLLDSMNISVDFLDVQSILTNELLIYPKDKTLALKEQFVHHFRIKTQEPDLQLYSKSLSNIEQLITVDRQNYRIKSTKINELDNQRYLNIEYIDLFSDEFKNIPKSIDIYSYTKTDKVSIHLNYTKVVKNKQLSFSFKVPSKYKVIKF